MFRYGVEILFFFCSSPSVGSTAGQEKQPRERETSLSDPDERDID